MSNYGTYFDESIGIRIGIDEESRYVYADLFGMPHLLIAGCTGSGKSVFLTSLLAEIIRLYSPDEARIMIFTHNKGEMMAFNGAPHLVCNVINEPQKALAAINWLTVELATRRKLYSEHGVRTVEELNRVLPTQNRIPKMVAVIEELSILEEANRNEVIRMLQVLLSQGRQFGIHVIITTQYPSSKILPEELRANIPVRIAFSVTSKAASRLILDECGAERLSIPGEMLYKPAHGTQTPIRLKSLPINDADLTSLLKAAREQYPQSYPESLQAAMTFRSDRDLEAEEEIAKDPLLADAAMICVTAGQCSVSMLQRKMRVGYQRAGTLVSQLEMMGIVAPSDGARPRDVLVGREELNTIFNLPPSEDDHTVASENTIHSEGKVDESVSQPDVPSCKLEIQETVPDEQELPQEEPGEKPTQEAGTFGKVPLSSDKRRQLKRKVHRLFCLLAMLFLLLIIGFVGSAFIAAIYKTFHS